MTFAHYPNIFPDTWRMVTPYLRIPDDEQVLDGLDDRAHCITTDSVITLAKLHRGQEGHLHIVVNYGIGLHLGVRILSETKTPDLMCDLAAVLPGFLKQMDSSAVDYYPTGMVKWILAAKRLGI